MQSISEAIGFKSPILAYAVGAGNVEALGVRLVERIPPELLQPSAAHPLQARLAP